MTTLMTPSSLSRNFLYMAGASSRLAGWVKARVDITGLDKFQERLSVGLDVGLTGLDGETLVHRRTQRKFVAHTHVNPGYGNGTRFAAAHDRLAEGVNAVGS